MKYKNLNRSVLKGLIALVFLASSIANSQSLTGTRGLIKAPTARMYESGTLAIGMGYVPAKNFRSIYYKLKYPGLKSGNSGLNTFITLNPLPFVEIMFRYSHELNIRINQNTKYFPDRMFTARLKLVNEKKYQPAIILGLQDISALTETTCKECSNFTATYLVGSKIFKFRDFNFDVSFGYAGDLLKLPAKDFKGIFGGVEIKHNTFREAQLLIDYDTTSLNIGLQGYLFNRIHTVIGLMDFEPMFILAYRYKI